MSDIISLLEHQDSLLRYARSLTGSNDAADLVQETYINAIQYQRNGKEISSPLAFLMTTLRNVFFDSVQKNKKYSVNEYVDEIIDESPTVQQQVISEKEFVYLCELISELPPKMRQSFVLKKVYGFTYREIGKQLGTSPKTVRCQVATAFKRLRHAK